MALNQNWRRFDITLGLDVFSGNIIKLIENEKKARFVFVDNDGNIQQKIYSGLTVDNTFKALFDDISIAI